MICSVRKPGTQPSSWLAVGCKRGELTDEMPEFCPSRSSDLVWLQRNNESVTTYEHVNECSQRAIKRRNEALLNAKTPFSSFNSPRSTSDIDQFRRSLELSFTSHPSVDPAHLSTLIPLNECIFAIVWEAIDCPKLEPTLSTNDEMVDQFILLRSAANYQASYANVSGHAAWLRLCGLVS
jgi:hypothetical protein